jgi:hypothetical protein
MVVLVVGVAVPFLALVAAIPIAWGWGLSWLDVGVAAVFYLVSGFGVTVGFHRYFTRLVQGEAGGFGWRWPRPVRWRWRVRSLKGWPTIGATTRSPTTRVTRTHRGGTARV